MLHGYPEPIDDAPHATHPRINDLPRLARERIAAALAKDKLIVAIKIVHENIPAIGLREAKVLCEALSLYWDELPGGLWLVM